MIDKLVCAYRNQIYDWDRKDYKKFYTKNKLLFWGFILFIAAIAGTLVISLTFHFYLLLYIFLPIELIICIKLDRITVKRYQIFISVKQEHIDKVALFLKTAVPGNNLFNKRQIEELISRLTNSIEVNVPFIKFKKLLSKFGNVIILPMITFIAGMYIDFIRQYDIVVVIAYAITVIILIGFAIFILETLLQGMQKIFDRNYDAAVAFKEDLLDIKLLYFINDDE